MTERRLAGESVSAINEQLGLGQWRFYRLLHERGVLRTISQARRMQEKQRCRSVA